MTGRVARSLRTWRLLAVLVLSACVAEGEGEATDVAESLSPNPCTAVTLTSPVQDFTITLGVPVVLSAAATCPAGQTPQYQYWLKRFGAPNWTILGPYVPGSFSWNPPSDEHWCVSAVTRAVGATETYQARSAARCNVARCGNGVLDGSEQCDDGNNVSGDGCEFNCTLPRCGNAILDTGEQCDDGNETSGDGCEPDCTLPRCGNGIVDAGEECDDGNATNGDACDSNCTLPRCGNGALDPGEECDDGNAANGDACDANCTLPRCGNAALDPGEECDDGNTVDGDGCDHTCTITGLTYVKASNTRTDGSPQGQNDLFGGSVALSADGTTMAVGASREAGGARGINGNQANGAEPGAGAVYVYTRSGPTWAQQAYVKASNTETLDFFGTSVALSADGSTLAVGAWGEDGGGGNQADNSTVQSGAVYIYKRTGTAWAQQAYVKASNAGAGDQFGTSVALSADGATLAVGANREASVASGVGGNQGDGGVALGAAYVFTRSGTAWTQQAYIKASNPDWFDEFATTIALSGDGSTLAVGAHAEASAATGINGNQADNSAGSAGAVYVFTRSGATWSQQAYVKASNTNGGDQFSSGLALSSNGATLAVGASGESSAAAGVGGNQADNTLPLAGAIYVFTRSGTTWSQQAYLKASNPGSVDQLGVSVALSGDGARLAAGAFEEASGARGIGGNQADNSVPLAGAAYVFTRTGAAWSQLAYVKSSNTGQADEFGFCVAESSDGSTLAVGAVGEASAATGIDGNQADNSAFFSGAVYVLQ